VFAPPPPPPPPYGRFNRRGSAMRLPHSPPRRLEFGLDVPPWLRRLEGELYRIRHESPREAPPPGRLTVDQLRAQIGSEWGGPLED